MGRLAPARPRGRPRPRRGRGPPQAAARCPPRRWPPPTPRRCRCGSTARTGAAPADLRLLTVDPGRPADDTSPGAPAASAPAPPPSPASTPGPSGAPTRASGSCSPGYSPTIKAGSSTTPSTPTPTPPTNSPALIRGIYAYHVQGNGWCDIGYNFLVDRFGRIFEGRYGGIDRPVIGAHAGGFNTDTFGVAAIGDFTSAPPCGSDADRISRCWAGSSGLHGRNPRFDHPHLGRRPVPAYASGTPVTFGMVSGHRDVDQTECPGDTLYPGRCRTATAAYVAANQAPTRRGRGPLRRAAAGGLRGRSRSTPSRLDLRLRRSRPDAATGLASGRPEALALRRRQQLAGSRGPTSSRSHRRNTASGRTEVQVVSAASSYRETVVSSVDPDVHLRRRRRLADGGRWARRPRPLPRRAAAAGAPAPSRCTPSASTPATRRGAARRHRPPPATRPLRTACSWPRVPATSPRRSRRHGIGRTEVHVLTAASRYRTFTAHAVTPLGPRTAPLVGPRQRAHPGRLLRAHGRHRDGRGGAAPSLGVLVAIGTGPCTRRPPCRPTAIRGGSSPWADPHWVGSAAHEGNHARRWLRDPPAPHHPRHQQAAHAGLRQADGLLPALDADDGGHPRDPRHHHPAGRRPVRAAAR